MLGMLIGGIGCGRCAWSVRACAGNILKECERAAGEDRRSG